MWQLNSQRRNHQLYHICSDGTLEEKTRALREHAKARRFCAFDSALCISVCSVCVCRVCTLRSGEVLAPPLSPYGSPPACLSPVSPVCTRTPQLSGVTEKRGASTLQPGRELLFPLEGRSSPTPPLRPPGSSIGTPPRSSRDCQCSHRRVPCVPQHRTRHSSRDASRAIT